jgi:hypothetical protein
MHDFGVHGVGAGGIHALIDCIEYAADQKRSPVNCGPSLGEYWLNVIKSQVGPRGGEVVKKLQMRHQQCSLAVKLTMLDPEGAVCKHL